MKGGVFPARISEAEARALIDAEPSMDGRDLARDVTPAEAVTLGPLGVGASGGPGGGGGGVRIAMIDTGVKLSIVRNLRERGATVELHPCTASAADLLGGDPDAIFLANGPGDPAALGYVVADGP